MKDVLLVLKDSQRLCMLLEAAEASRLWGQWWEGTWAQNHPALTPWGAEGDPCPPHGCHRAWSPLITCAGRDPPGTPLDQQELGGRATDFIRYMIYKYIVPFWMVDYFFPCSFYAQQFIVLRKSTSSILSFVACAFDSRSKKSWPNPRSWGLTFMFILEDL